MKDKKEKIFLSIRFKLFMVFMILLLGTCICVFTFFTYRFSNVYNSQVNSHMADVTALSTANVSNMVDQIDQLSVSILVDQVVQDNLSVINGNVG